MPISFSCGQCGKDYVVSDGLGGKRAVCKACGNRMTIPGAVGIQAGEAREVVHGWGSKRDQAAGQPVASPELHTRTVEAMQQIPATRNRLGSKRNSSFKPSQTLEHTRGPQFGTTNGERANRESQRRALIVCPLTVF
jgi:hypothetical protein